MTTNNPIKITVPTNIKIALAPAPKPTKMETDEMMAEVNRAITVWYYS